MNRKMELAIKVMELANDFTNWDFELIDEGDICVVGAALYNHTGLDMYVYYKIADERAQLDVYVPVSEYDEDFVSKKVKELNQKFPVGVVDLYEETLDLWSGMSLQVFESEMQVIVRERMTDMVETMTAVINHERENKEMKECYVVGNVYKKAINRQEGVLFGIDDCGISLNVYLRKPTAHETEQFASGKTFEMRLVQLRNVIFPMFKFGNMGWMHHIMYILAEI